MLKLSFSQIKLFKSSPLDYFYRYVQRLPEKDNETKWLHFGLGVHQVLEDYYSGVDHNWQENTIKRYEEYNLKGRMKFEDFKKNIVNGISLAWPTTDLEEEMLTSVYDDVGFIGFIDVLDKKNHTILDWKTGTYTKAKEEDYKSQLLCYAWMYHRKYGIVPTQCCLFFTKQAKLVPFTFTLQQINQFENYIKKVSHEIKWKKLNHTEAEDWGNELGFFSGYHYLDNLPTMKFVITLDKGGCYLSGSISPLLKEGLKKHFAVDHQSKFFMQKKVQERYGRPSYYDDIGTKYLFNDRDMSFSLGMIDDVKEQLKLYADHKNSKFNITIVDNRDKKVHNNKLTCMPNKLLNGVELRDYQMNAVYSFIVNNGIGTINAGTGAGKTFLTAEIIRRMNTKTLWIINQKELLYQTKEEFEKVLGIDIGVIGDGKAEYSDVTVATIQTLNRRVKENHPETLDYLASVNFVITDETHNVACDMYEKVFKVLRNTKYRLGTTGTAFREDNQERRIFALTGSIIYTIDAEQLIDEGYLMKPEIKFFKIEKSNIKKINYLLLSTEERRQLKDTEFAREYEEGVVFNPERNNLIKSILSEHQNDKVLIIVKSIEHGELLEMNNDGALFIHGSLNKTTRKEYFDILKGEKPCVVIATIKIASEGLDVPDLSVLINASGNKSDNRSVQALGRILRKHKDKSQATYIDFIDKSKHGSQHSWQRVKAFKEQGHKVNIIKQKDGK